LEGSIMFSSTKPKLRLITYVEPDMVSSHSSVVEVRFTSGRISKPRLWRGRFSFFKLPLQGL